MSSIASCGKKNVLYFVVVVLVSLYVVARTVCTCSLYLSVRVLQMFCLCVCVSGINERRIQSDVDADASCFVQNSIK